MIKVSKIVLSSSEQMKRKLKTVTKMMVHIGKTKGTQ